MLNIDHLNKFFIQGPTKIEVLKNLCLDLESKDSLAIVGKSGSGKSTLLSLLAGLDRPASGHIILNGISYAQFSEKEMTEFRAKNIGIVFQNYNLFPSLTALENVALPAQIAGDKSAYHKARELLQMVGLEPRLTHLPSQLSGGECQRVALARALVTQPKLLLADEPSGNLDNETSEIILNLLFKTISDLGVTTIFVTHSMDLASRCRRLSRLEDGHLVHVNT